MLHAFFDPYFVVVQLCAVVIAVCWLLSVVTREYSWVDRIWSIIPAVYAWIIAAQSQFASARVVLIAVLTTLWAARLTFNFARKGGYKKGGEDYRWAILRERIGPVGFQLFNATFIAPFQNILLLLIVAPIITVAKYESAGLGIADVLLAVAFLALLLGETVADEQQWRFHKAKAERKARGESGPEFCTTGLFRFSRHPNFFCEVSQWWVVYGFAVVASGEWLHWSIAGAIVLTALFQGSTNMTEGISKSKYPAYAEYQRTTSRLMPWFPAK
ncbi:MAG: DUF1295 domain-containing protein [Archangium sp.]